MRQTQKRAYHNAGRKSSGLPGNISAAKPPFTITHDQWLGAVGTVSLAWRLTSRYDSPTKLTARSCAHSKKISHLLAEGEDWACPRTHRPPRRLHHPSNHQAVPVPGSIVHRTLCRRPRLCASAPSASATPQLPIAIVSVAARDAFASRCALATDSKLQRRLV